MRSAEPVRLVEVLGRQEHGGPGRDEGLDRLPEADPAADVEPCRRLVQEQDRRSSDERRGEIEPAPHAARVGLHEPRAGLAEVEVGKQLERALSRSAPAEVVEAADQLQVLEARQVLVDRGVLPGEPDALADELRLAEDVASGDARGSRIRGEKRGQDADGRRLPRSVRAEQTVHRPRPDAQVDAPQSMDVPVALLQTARVDREALAHDPSGTGRRGPALCPRRNA